MQQRRRAIGSFITRGHSSHASFDAFLEQPLCEGLHSIKSNNRWFDFAYEDRGAAVTLITFSAAVPARVETYPRFSGRRIAEKLETNWLAFSDAAIGSAESLATFWHLGTRRVETSRFIPAIVHKLQLENPDQALIFFGSSAGGFAALNYGSHFPGTASFVMNPRIDVCAPPHVFDKYAPVAFMGFPRDRLLRDLPLNMAMRYASPLGNHVYYLQNLQDSSYVRHHYRQFREAVCGRDDVEFITGEWGAGHVVPPPEAYLGRLRDLVKHAHLWS